MTNIFKLDDIRSAAERRFAPTKFELGDGTVVALPSVLRLGEKAREKVFAAIDEITDIQDQDDKDDSEVAEAVVEVTGRILAEVADRPKKLLASLEHDDIEVQAHLYMTVLTRWTKEVQMGGSRVLAELIDKHGGAILSDLLHEYGVDLRDMFDDDTILSPRYVLNLIVNLPETSAFYASRRGGHQYRGWDIERYMLVALVNGQRMANYMFQLANRDPKKSSVPPAPEPFPVPDEMDKKKKPAPKPGSFAAVAAQMIAAQRRKKEMAYGRSGAGYSPGQAGHIEVPTGTAIPAPGYPRRSQS
ncbi:tail assembly chaperone [Gordonia phage MinecraftSteve]|nr:tail assembly chaperone [Gordonia phage MinecraftSteve]